MEEINISYNLSGFYKYTQGLEALLIYGSPFRLILKGCSAEGFFEFFHYLTNRDFYRVN